MSLRSTLSEYCIEADDVANLLFLIAATFSVFLLIIWVKERPKK